MNEINSDDSEWARLIYKNQLDGTEAVKRRQWLTANYVLLIFAALIGYSKLFYDCQNANISNPLFFFLLALSFFFSLVGIYHLIDMHFVMTRYRIKAFYIAEQYDFVKRIDKVDGDEKINFKYYFISLTGLFIALILFGLMLVFFFLYKIAGISYSRCQVGLCLTLILISDFIFSWMLTDKKNKDIEEFKRKLYKNRRIL